jgi:alpha-galactosidase
MISGDLLWYDQVGNLDLFWPGGPRLHDLSARVQLERESLYLPGDEPRCEMGADGATWHAEGKGLQVAWRWQSRMTSDGAAAADGWDVWLEVTNVGRRAVSLRTLVPLRALSCDLRAPAFSSLYQHGWSSWTPTFARQRKGDHYTEPGTPFYRLLHQPHHPAGSEREYVSEWVTVLHSPAANLLLGFVTAADQLASIHLDDPNLTVRCWLDGATLPPGGSVRSERLWLRAGNDPLALLEDWAGRLGREMDARVDRRIRPENVTRPPSGWSTWCRVCGTEEAADTADNLAVIAAQDLPLDVILIDDGYQTCVGDWLSANARFPEGMAALASRIRASGHAAGIWTAPFGAASTSQLFNQHPDWFIRDEQAHPIVAWRHQNGTDCFALDPTHPDVATWLAETYRTLREEWGYSFFKIDFLFAAALEGRRHDKSATRAGSLRRGLEIIRRAIGDEAFLLASGAPQAVCVGLVDGMRVGPDVAPYWSPPGSASSDTGIADLSMPAQMNALRNSIARAPFHNRLWLNDPDCLIVRRQGSGSDLSLDEVRSQVTLTALLGGLTMAGDDLRELSKGRVKYLRQALPPTGLAARPLDLFSKELPGRLLLRVERDWGHWWIAALINWEDETVETTLRLTELTLPPGRYHVYDYWRRRYLGVVRDQITVPFHRRHETLVLLFKPVANHPELLTSTFHVGQGLVEVADVQRYDADDGFHVAVTLEKPGRQFGRLLFTTPGGWRADVARVGGVRRRLGRIVPGVIGLGMTLSGRATVDIAFQKTGAESAD